jgi:hypothetical protein
MVSYTLMWCLLCVYPMKKPIIPTDRWAPQTGKPPSSLGFHMAKPTDRATKVHFIVRDSPWRLVTSGHRSTKPCELPSGYVIYS